MLGRGIFCNNTFLILSYFTKSACSSSDDLERYSQLQYTLITDENATLKDIEELLMQALVYRLIVFAYEVSINFQILNPVVFFHGPLTDSCFRSCALLRR